MKKFCNAMAGICGFLAILCFAFLILNENLLHLAVSADVTKILRVVCNAVLFASAVFAGLAFCVPRGIVLTVVFLVLAVLVCMAQFFPGILAQLLQDLGVSA